MGLGFGVRGAYAVAVAGPYLLGSVRLGQAPVSQPSLAMPQVHSCPVQIGLVLFGHSFHRVIDFIRTDGATDASRLRAHIHRRSTRRAPGPGARPTLRWRGEGME